MHDFQARLTWCITPEREKGNHAPVITFPEGQDRTVKKVFSYVDYNLLFLTALLTNADYLYNIENIEFTRCIRPLTEYVISARSDDSACKVNDFPTLRFLAMTKTSTSGEWSLRCKPVQ